MLNEVKEIYSEMRNCGIGNKFMGEVYNYPQPGLFLGSRILFIAQNPGKPRPEENPSDKILMNLNSTDEEHHSAYEKSQKNWLFYKKFIRPIIGDSQDFSIMNIVFYPTISNTYPSADLLRECVPYVGRLIKLINPRVIVAVGSLSATEVGVINFKLQNKYRLFGCKHYSHLLRGSSSLLRWEIEKIKGELEVLDE